MQISRTKMWLWIVAVTALAVGVAVVLEPDGYLLTVALAIVLVVGLMGVMVQLKQPLLGLGILVMTAIAFPLEARGPGGVMVSSSLPLAAVVCGVWLLRMLAVRSGLHPSRVVYAGIGLIAATLVSFTVGQFPWYPQGAPVPAQVVELGLIMLSVMLFLVTGHQITSIKQLKYLTAAVIVIGLVAAIIQTIPSLAMSVGRWSTRPGSIGSLFWTWLVAMSAGQALFNRKLSPLTRLFLLAVLGLVFYHGVVQARAWASGWMPAAIALGIVFFFRFPRLTVGLGLVGAPLALLFYTQLTGGVMGDEEYSLMSREQAWVTLMQLVVRSPIVGTGLANYYYYTENFPLLGWYVRFIAHNNYQDLLVQTGAVGLLSFFWFSFEAGLMSLQMQKLAKDDFSYGYVVGALGGLVGSLAAGMLGDWIIPFYYNGGVLGFRSSLLFWVFLGGVLFLKRLHAQTAESDAPVADRVAPSPARGYRKFPQPDLA